VFDVFILLRKSVFLDKNVAIKFDMATFIPVRIGRAAQIKLAIDLFPEPMLIKKGVKG
jgi:hypothetical protein